MLVSVYCGKLFQRTRIPTTFRMAQSLSTRTYEAAIQALNNLQTNSEVLDAVLKERQKNVHLNLPITQTYLERSGMTLDDLDCLPIIHVSGTKGKGSTCAFTESILCQYGLKTGFFSSPHLISATERIRLNGHPISESEFSSYFWKVYDKVCLGYTDKPAYFKFLTILAFNIFFKEKVDVAIIEVGVGGMYDCTNIIRNPVACGITKLDLDHTSLLGDTIDKIAWQKSGIMKHNKPIFIDGDQPQSALQVISDCAKYVGCPLFKVPDLDSYDWGHFPRKVLGLYGAMNHQNASLALQLSNQFLNVRHPELKRKCDESESRSRHLNGFESEIETARAFDLRAPDALGLRLCSWPGRTQVLLRGNHIFFLDGAHTELSCRGCRSWFDFVSEHYTGKRDRAKIFKVLIFNATKDRKAETLLTPFVSADFDHVIFCTNIPRTSDRTDNANFTTTFEKEEKRISEHSTVWSTLQNLKLENNLNLEYGIDLEKHAVTRSIPCSVIPYNDDALKHVEQLAQGFQQVQVLVTGSLHLIGGILNLIQPDLWNRQKCAQQMSEERKLVQSYNEIRNEKKSDKNVKLSERM